MIGSQEFAVALRRARKHAGLTQQQVAERTGYSRASIANLERGAQDPPLSAVYALSAVLCVPAGALVDNGGQDAELLEQVRAARLALRTIHDALARAEQTFPPEITPP